MTHSSDDTAHCRRIYSVDEDRRCSLYRYSTSPTMPTITLVNDTSVPLHISLKQVSPLYYENNVPPSGGKAVFKNVGPVWFTIEARIARVQAEGQKAENEYTNWDR